MVEWMSIRPNEKFRSLGEDVQNFVISENPDIEIIVNFYTTH